MSFPLRELNIFIFHAILLRKLVYMSLSLISLKWASNQLLHAPIRVRLRFDLVNNFFGKIWLIVFIHILVTTKIIKSETGNKKSNMNHQSYNSNPQVGFYKTKGQSRRNNNHSFHKFRIVHIKQASLI